MIDDTGPRITALERRVAEIEARMVAQPIPATNSSGTPSLAEAIRPFMALGRPEGLLGAFHDLHEDAVLYENSGVAITVGDLRALQAAWLDLKGTP